MFSNDFGEREYGRNESTTIGLGQILSRMNRLMICTGKAGTDQMGKLGTVIRETACERTHSIPKVYIRVTT